MCEMCGTVREEDTSQGLESSAAPPEAPAAACPRDTSSGSMAEAMVEEDTLDDSSSSSTSTSPAPAPVAPPPAPLVSAAAPAATPAPAGDLHLVSWNVAGLTTTIE